LRLRRRVELPSSDASKNGFGIQVSVARKGPKRRRQNPVVVGGEKAGVEKWQCPMFSREINPCGFAPLRENAPVFTLKESGQSYGKKTEMGNSGSTGGEDDSISCGVA
jgi:hypothetical protein